MDTLQQWSRNEGECAAKKRLLRNTQDIDQPCSKKHILQPEVNKSSIGEKSEETVRNLIGTRQQKKDASKEEPPNQKLPCELLLILFSYLSIPDLVSVQRVCSGWRAAAQDKSLWKNYTLTLYGTPEDERKVLLMPAVRNIAGKAVNNFVNIIFKYVIELVQLRCQFIPPLSSLQVRTIARKFPKLEAINLDISESNILESLGLMKASKHIKEIYFTFCYSHGNYKHKSSSRLMNILSVFNDSENFSGLTHIDVSDTDIWLAATREEAFVNVLVGIINQRSQQLLSLKVIVSNIDSENLMNAVNMCTNLHTLQIDVFGGDQFAHPIYLNIGRMAQLRSLKIRMLNMTACLPTFFDFLYNGSSSHVRELKIATYVNWFTCNVLKAVIQNFTGLTELIFSDSGPSTSENDLKNIGRLSKLKKLVISGFKSCTEEGIGYLSECKNLKYLVFLAEMSSVDDLNPLIANMINQMKELETLLFNIAERSTFLLGRGQIEEFICENLGEVQ